MTETFNIPEKDLEVFKSACKSATCEVLFYKDGVVTIEYKYPHNLYYLGRQFTMKKQIEEYETN